MAALDNLQHSTTSDKSPIKSGVLTIYGFGIRLRMQSGHLEIEDGIGPERRKIRLARVGHKLKRLVCISEDGFATLSALKWLGDVGVSFVMLDRVGKVLLATGPTASSDVRLRRSQAIAHSSGAALRIACELIDKKLVGQERVARHKLLAVDCADTIHRYRSELAEAETLERVRLVESMAAAAYWSAWRQLPITFPRKDEQRLPDHWRTFGTRVSPLTGSPRLAVNPPNAMLNYLYALLESEARLACAALGLDPGMGVLHVDTKARDSLACDVMEPVRPQVDAFLLDWITHGMLKRAWLFEQRDGNCRLMSSFAARLSETAPMWGRAVAPIAESVARTFWSSTPKQQRPSIPPTRLTQRKKREAKGAPSLPESISPPQRENVCRGCGKTITNGRTTCAECAIDAATTRMVDAARVGRLTANSPQANAKRASTQRQNALAQHSWKASSQPAWLTDEVYSDKIQPLLANISTSVIASSIGVSRCYAGNIRKGRFRPHPRHWLGLAELAGISVPVFVTRPQK
jgi:CRISPR-associated endonuclease Cas1